LPAVYGREKQGMFTDARDIVHFEKIQFAARDKLFALFEQILLSGFFIATGGKIFRSNLDEFRDRADNLAPIHVYPDLDFI